MLGEALELYETLLKERPDNLVLVNNVASLISDHHTDSQSIDRAFALAFRLKDVGVPQFKDTLGWLYYLKRDFRAAVHCSKNRRRTSATIPSFTTISEPSMGRQATCRKPKPHSAARRSSPKTMRR